MQETKYLNQESELAGVLDWWKTKKKPVRPGQTKGYQEGRLLRQMTLDTTTFFTNGDETASAVHMAGGTRKLQNLAQGDSIEQHPG